LFVALTCVLLAGVAKSDEKPDGAAGDLETLYGLWRGSWGGGEDDGVFYQPVRAELYIGMGQAVWQGLPMADGTGAISLSSGEPGRGRFTYSVAPKGRSTHPVPSGCRRHCRAIVGFGKRVDDTPKLGDRLP
jgi:hypothetical protein